MAVPFALRVSTSLKMTGARNDAIRNLQTTIYRTDTTNGRPAFPLHLGFVKLPKKVLYTLFNISLDFILVLC